MPGKQSSRDLRRAIRKVLLDTWDPIGIRNEPNAQDEYEAYEADIVGFLTRGSSDEEITAYLQRVEVDRMGMPAGNPEHLRPVVDALRALDLRPA